MDFSLPGRAIPWMINFHANPLGITFVLLYFDHYCTLSMFPPAQVLAATIHIDGGLQ